VISRLAPLLDDLHATMRVEGGPGNDIEEHFFAKVI
jgi:hypothetical protein